jgi:sigma-B regulation protein RsbU (phosphoserine phosphatase)
MSHTKISASSVWSQINKLGEELLSNIRLDEQCVLIEKIAASLLKAEIELWLDENLFRLPGLNQSQIFSKVPPEGLMRRAFHKARGCCQQDGAKEIAVPLRSQEITIGVLAARHSANGNFRTSDIECLETLAGHAALSLIASHRFSVEQWRVEQLKLVRRVSAKIANVLDLDALTPQVTKLILDTFKYYYVAIFTLEPGQKNLVFWSSAGPGKHKTKQKSLQGIIVELGQGLIGEAAKSGQEIISNDVSRDSRYRRLEPLSGTQSEVVLPMKIGKRVEGVLDIQSDRLDAFHPNDLLVLRALADSIAIAINSIRLYSDLEHRANQLSIISEVSKDISSVLELDELLSRVVELVQARLKFPHVHLYTVHLNRRQIIFETGSGERIDALKGYVIDLDNSEGMIPWVARNGQSILANNVDNEPRYKPSLFLPLNIRSELTIPLLYDKKPIGVLDLQSDQNNIFSEDDKFVLEALADTIAAAIHNADLFRTERWRRQVADSLREVAGLLSADVGVDDVLDSVLRELERNLPCDVSAAWLMEGEELYQAHIHGADMVEVEAAMQRWPEVNRYLFDVLATIQPIIRKPADSFDPTGLARGYSADYSSIAVSMRVGDRPLGVLTLAHHTSGRYGHEAQAITSTFANYAAVAIENARLYDSAQEQAYASAALLQVAQTVVNSSDLDEIIGSIVRITPILVGVKACSIYLWEGECFRPSQAYGFPEEVQPLLFGSSFSPGDFHLLDIAHETGKMVIGVLTKGLPEDWLDPELARDTEESYYALQTSEYLLIGIPLAIRNDFYGVMLIQEDAESRRFRQKRIEIIAGIAQQVAMSIQNDHLQQEMVARERFEHEIQLARQIQQTFLPERLPEFPEWDMAATWRTALQVGGDFYDVFELPDRKLGLLIADVSDKGIPAALFMALTRTLVRAAVLDTISPAEVMHKVNELIIPDNREEMFVTAVYGVLSLDQGSFTYANAGHNPPIWISGETRKLVSLPRTCAALGVIEGMEIKEKTIPLGFGDTLLLYTDGLTEAFSPDDEIFGVENLEQILSTFNISSTHELLGFLESAVENFIGSLPATDDLTMLAIQRRKKP